MAQQNVQPTRIKRTLDDTNSDSTSKPDVKRRRLNDYYAYPKLSKLTPHLHREPTHFPNCYYPILDDITECTKSIHTSITETSITRTSKPMTSEIVNAARKYYLHIVNDQQTTFQQKKDIIYKDLVVGPRSDIKMKEDELKQSQKDSEFELKYQIGLTNQEIKSVEGSVITFGRFEENDICCSTLHEAISRIQCFIFIIEDSLIVMDGWSWMGTKTIKVNNKKNNLYDSLPHKRVLLRFNKTDTIHLRFGEVNNASNFEQVQPAVDLIINPKECVICMDKARVIRNDCGHYVLCRNCYNNILSQSNSQCPICRMSLKSNGLLIANGSVATYHPTSVQTT